MKGDFMIFEDLQKMCGYNTEHNYLCFYEIRKQKIDKTEYCKKENCPFIKLFNKYMERKA